MEQISKTDWSFITQKSSMATTHRMLKRTAMPTNTVEARKAGLKMEEKLTKLPMHWMSGLGNNSEIPEDLPKKSPNVEIASKI